MALSVKMEALLQTNTPAEGAELFLERQREIKGDVLV